eukprot:3761375-Prymnesium_polylepis.1
MILTVRVCDDAGQFRSHADDAGRAVVAGGGGKSGDPLVACGWVVRRAGGGASGMRGPSGKPGTVRETGD